MGRKWYWVKKAQNQKGPERPTFQIDQKGPVKKGPTLMTRKARTVKYKQKRTCIL